MNRSWIMPALALLWTVIVAATSSVLSVGFRLHDSEARLVMFGTSIQELQAAARTSETVREQLRDLIAEMKQADAVTNERVLFIIETLRDARRTPKK